MTALAGLRGRKVWLHVMGCRSNLYEGDAIAGDLEARGAQIADEPEGADAAVIVSCSVTAVSDRKCRQAVRRARRAVGGGVVSVCGCWAQSLDPDEAVRLGIDLLVGTRLKNRLAEELDTLLSGEAHLSERRLVDLRMELRPGDGGRLWDSLSLRRPVLHTRAFLKVQEGCDHFCSYCVIPFLRGRSTSRPLESVLEEARRVIGAGCFEVVLTGIHLGMYGRDSGSSLAALVAAVSDLPGLKRLRLGSLEPFALDAQLLAALADSPVFAPHLHLPMQSGDDGVLARMRRGYTASEFLGVCELARERLGDDLHISTDVMVAFPGESDAAFDNTLAVMERAALGRVHVFPYSPRRGTEAAAFKDRVSSAAASERAERAAELGRRLLHDYACRFVGRRLPVLVETVEDCGFRGYTPHFIYVRAAGRAEKGALVEVTARSCDGGELTGVS